MPSAGKTVCWPSFSSTSLSYRVAQEFVGYAPFGLIFIIEGRSAKRIDDCSKFPSEQEMLFAPNTQFKVEYLAKVTDWEALYSDAAHLRIRVTEEEAEAESRLIIVMEEL